MGQASAASGADTHPPSLLSTSCACSRQRASSRHRRFAGPAAGRTLGEPLVKPRLEFLRRPPKKFCKYSYVLDNTWPGGTVQIDCPLAVTAGYGLRIFVLDVRGVSSGVLPSYLLLH